MEQRLSFLPVRVLTVASLHIFPWRIIMRIPHLSRRSRSQDSTMTPMIDVVFLLLIFFIVASARQVREAVLPAELPPGSVAATTAPVPLAQPERALINLHRTAAAKTILEMNGTTYETLPELEQQLLSLSQVAPDIPVVLDVDGPVPFGDVADVYDLCQRLRFETLKFAITTVPSSVK